MTDVKPYVYIYIQLQTKLHKYFTIIYIYIHDYIYMKIWNNVFTSMQKLDSHKKPELGGSGGGCSPPKKVEYGTQGVYTGQHASCDHMERMLRQNRDSHGKRGETQIK